ncbi:YbjN domain-containing protein [Ectopseudomonas chengduensis]|nr:YbjN domain-containing protein [Pseudomonas chengduensis]UZT80853.1 YbjN domain-containing protein [Pseudomonas chengduensis]
MSTEDMIQSVTPQHITEHLQASGYRVNQVEQGGSVQLLSASQGIGFAVRFGNPAVVEGSFLDFTFNCALRIQGELPAGLAEVWNATRRFARLSQQGDFLVLEMDAIIAAGVSEDHLKSLIELWDRLLQEFVVYLREYSQQQARQPAEAPMEAEETADSEA